MIGIKYKYVLFCKSMSVLKYVLILCYVEWSLWLWNCSGIVGDECNGKV